MKQRGLQGTLLVAVLLAVVYLLRVDWSEKIEADVSSLIPDDDSAETKVFRSLIGDRQGKVVYLSVDFGDLGEGEKERATKIVVDEWGQSTSIKSIEVYNEGAFRGFMAYAAEHRVELLFPGWFAKKRSAYEEGKFEAPFEDWLSQEVETDLENFLESPAAMELAREEVVDPFLLVVHAILRLEASGQLDRSEESASRVLFWVELAGSPLEPITQSALDDLVAKTSEKLKEEGVLGEIEYAGLVRLAEASRKRIHRDIGKVNGISFGLVLLVSLIMIRPPWRLLYALPVVACSLLTGLVVSLLAFDQVSVVVIVIGSILIGTSIDYAFHTLFSDASKRSGTRRLLLIACGSTVVGFGILLSAEMPVIRQIGMFVGSGLLGAFIASMALPIKTPDKRCSGSRSRASQAVTNLGYVSVLLWVIVLVVGIVFVQKVQWKEDIRNLEAPDPEAVARDLDLREKFGANFSGKAFFSLGADYLDALGEQAQFLKEVRELPGSPDLFSPSELLPTAGEIALVKQFEYELPDWLTFVQKQLLESGYDGERFQSYFDDAKLFIKSANEASVESRLVTFTARLTGPLALILGKGNEQAWVVSIFDTKDAALDEVAAKHASVVQLSQRDLLDKSLEHLRNGLLKHGVWGMLAVSLVVLVLVRPRKGVLVLGIPAFSVLAALVFGMWIGGSLNLFHLIACFLGGVISLDYALFAVDAVDDGRSVPFSVWLSGTTTGASFFALTTSYIGGVRDLGWTVFLVTATTLFVILCLSQLRRARTET